MKKYQNALIVGKFSPLHKGHEYLIETALRECEQLFIFSYSNPEFGAAKPFGASNGSKRFFRKQIFLSLPQIFFKNVLISLFLKMTPRN